MLLNTNILWSDAIFFAAISVLQLEQIVRIILVYEWKA